MLATSTKKQKHFRFCWILMGYRGSKSSAMLAHFIIRCLQKRATRISWWDFFGQGLANPNANPNDPKAIIMARCGSSSTERAQKKKVHLPLII